MEPEILSINVKENVGIKDLGLGGGGAPSPFEKFLQENGYQNDGSFLLSTSKEKDKAFLWKRVATFDGPIPVKA